MTQVTVGAAEGAPDEGRWRRLGRWGASAPWGRGDDRLTGWRRWVFAVSSSAALLYVLFLHGYLPGMSQTPLTAYIGTGAIQCFHDQGVASLWNWCMSTGLPIGTPRLTGLPEVYLGWLVSYVPGVDAWGAHQISLGALDALSLLGAFLLVRRWHFPRWLALMASVSYLTAANVLILNGFPYTFMGYLLLPAFVYCALRILDRMTESKWLATSIAAFGLALFMVFTDGYAFFSALLVIAFLVLAWIVRGWSTHGHRVSIVGGLVWFASIAGAGFLYWLWVPDNAYEAHAPLESFALLGIDVKTFLVPSARFLYPRLFDLHIPPLQTWGINSTAPTNYMGYIALVLVVAYLVIGRRRLPGKHTGEILVLALAGAVALLMSLGPTLKIGQIEPGIEASIMTLPTAWIYENVPGISEMRATNRWFIVTRLALIVLAGSALSVLWHRWRGTSTIRAIVIVVLACAVVLETMPNLWNLVRERELSIEHVHRVRDGVVAEADAMLEDGERILILPSLNDFLANYLVPMTGTQSYNVGGDKNYALAVSTWPDSVIAARDGYGPDAADLLCEVLKADADAIVLTYTTQRWAALIRPEDEEDATRRAWALELSQDRRFDAQVGTWIVTIRAHGESCSS